MDATLIWSIAGLIVLVVLFRGYRKNQARKRERESLRYDNNSGTYIWTTAGGGTSSSKIHPDDPGGAWHSDGGSRGFGGGGFDGGGFDGGGGGGGGD